LGGVAKEKLALFARLRLFALQVTQTSLATFNAKSPTHLYAMGFSFAEEEEFEPPL